MFDEPISSASIIIVHNDRNNYMEETAIKSLRESLIRLINLVRFSDYAWLRELEVETKLDPKELEQWDPMEEGAFVKRINEELRYYRQRVQANRFARDHAKTILLEDGSA